ncbi:hypothetical protein ACTSKR_09520 [Chitinibacteraceae bacterium HSL-7]
MGSRSSSANTQQINNEDRRIAMQSGMAVSGDGSSLVANITSTDHGAIAGAYAATEKALSTAGTVTSEAIAAVRAGAKDAQDYGVKVFETAAEAMGESQNTAERVLMESLSTVNKNALAATAAVGNAWENAKAAADGKSLGDFKYVLLAVAGVMALLVWRKG